ncbi:hypothetical protein DMX10_18155 [Pseudomonas sp. 57B-090624]|nr:MULTISPECIES: signal peptidase II [Pseudomonas]MDW3713289.1 signal peptidase II [Pseudomonas sp. 2023EL-01195]PZE12007.1 hypothetical protein DMX10_18155 [Pseudomonas sp. 57B-090624]
MISQARAKFVFLALSVSVVVMDQITKHVVDALLEYSQLLELFPALALQFSYNTGAAFGGFNCCFLL